jgi:hypothetical protein
MRPLLAAVILLVGVRGAAPETKFQDALPDIGTGSISASLNLGVVLGNSDRVLFIALPSIESSDTAHDQGEQAALPAPSAPASTDTNADADVVDSLEGLCKALMTSAQDYQLPVPFFANLIWQESGLKHDAVSKVGAQGIAQFMPQVAAEEGLSDPFDPRQAIPASARLLHTLREHFGNLGFAAAAYNAGPRRVGEWLDRRRALPIETHEYVVRVTGRTIEAWRKSPVDDSRLTFVRLLPCRQLPAFAELEQSQLKETLSPAAAGRTQATSQRAKSGAKLIARLPLKSAAKDVQKVEKEPVFAEPVVAERKPVRKVTPASVALARNVHSGVRDVIHHPRAGA